MCAAGSQPTRRRIAWTRAEVEAAPARNLEVLVAVVLHQQPHLLTGQHLLGLVALPGRVIELCEHPAPVDPKQRHVHRRAALRLVVHSRRRHVVTPTPPVGSLQHGHVVVVARTADRMRDRNARVLHLSLAVREAVGELEVALADLEEAGAADGMAAGLESAGEVRGDAPARTRNRVQQRVRGHAAPVAPDARDCVRRVAAVGVAPAASSARGLPMPARQ